LILPFLCMTATSMQQALVACLAHSSHLLLAEDLSEGSALQAVQFASGCLQQLVGFCPSSSSLRLSWTVLTDMGVLNECSRFMHVLATTVFGVHHGASSALSIGSRDALILAYRMIWMGAAAQVAGADASQMSSDPVIFHAFDVLESLASVPCVVQLIAAEASKFFAAIQSVSVSSSEFTCSVVGRVIGLLSSFLSTGIFDSAIEAQNSERCKLAEMLSCDSLTDKDLLALRLSDVSRLFTAPMQRQAENTSITACWHSAIGIVRSFARQLLSCNHIPVGNEEEFLTPWLQNGILQLPLMDFDQPIFAALKEQRQRWSKWTGTSKGNVAVAQRLASLRLQAQNTNADIDNSLQAILLSFAPDSMCAPRHDALEQYSAGVALVSSLLEFSLAGADFVAGDAANKLVAWLTAHAKVNSRSRIEVQPAAVRHRAMEATRPWQRQ
jgi:hypothetical protein